MAKLSVGDLAPDFTLTSETGETVSLRPALGRGPVLLIFYPMDNTPGCTAQLCAVRESDAVYKAAGVQVYGVNGGSAESHRRFVAKHALTAPLLVDAGLEVASRYGAAVGFAPFKLINRTVVGIARDGTIAFYKRGSPPAPEILAALGAVAT